MQRLRPFRLLLVEDNPDDVELTRRALLRGDVDIDLYVARDGQEALDFLAREGSDGTDTPRPDLILLDLGLPRVNGLEVLERLRPNEGLSAIPVVVLSASDRDEDVVRSYQLGANTYILKPVESEHFQHAIEVLGEYWMVVARLPP